MKKRRTKKSILATVLVLTLLLTSTLAVDFCKLPKAVPESVVSDDKGSLSDTKFFNDTKAAKAGNTKKPGQVKSLKKVKVSKSSVKIKFNKVKGASGYQILIYQRMKADGFHKTPIVFYKNTKKTTYTIKNLMPGLPYKIKVRAYKKDKNGKVVYGKMKSIDVKTTGRINQIYIVCNTCIVAVPNGNVHAEHYKSARKIHNEVHAGCTIVWK